MTNKEFEKAIKKTITFEKEDVELYFINVAYTLRRYDIPDKEIIEMLANLYSKARNDVIRSFH